MRAAQGGVCVCVCAVCSARAAAASCRLSAGTASSGGGVNEAGVTTVSSDSRTATLAAPGGIRGETGRATGDKFAELPVGARYFPCSYNVL